MKITFQLLSYWAIGTGKGGGSLDTIVLKDKENLPYIPGRTFKGLLRDAYKEIGGKYESLLFGHELSKKNTENVKLDNEILKQGLLRFNSVKLTKNRDAIKTNAIHLYQAKTYTSLDKNKQTVKHSLRKTEVCVPVELSSNITLQNNNIKEEYKFDNDQKQHIINDLEKACKMLRFIGEKRHRGMGRCKLTCSNTEKLFEEKNNDPIEFDSQGNNRGVFLCTVNDPIILVKKDKTSHNIESLDYLPGNNIRGIVAATLFRSQEDNNIINDIVFNNKVQFNDAHLVINDKRSLKTPFSFYQEKKTEKNIFENFHKITEWHKKRKQIRKGYFIPENSNIEIQDIAYSNSIKSSRNHVQRSSQKQGLYTKHSIDAGQKFQFSVETTEPEELEKIIKALPNKKHYFGQSKGAEFGGSIDIKCIETTKKIKSDSKMGSLIYAESNLCFLNKYGEFTALPTGKQLTGIEDAIIDWSKSQIRTRTYAPYNGFRKNWDTERLIIEKGSVFILKKEVEIDTSKKGLFQTEGFGNIIVDPHFLTQETITFSKKETTFVESVKSKKYNDVNLDNYLKERVRIQKNRQAIISKVNVIKNKFFQRSNSQWARVYNATTITSAEEELNKLLFYVDNGERDKSIMTGGSKRWDPEDVIIMTSFFNEKLTENEKIEGIRRLAKQKISQK